MDTTKLTDAVVKRREAPATGNRITYDPTAPGFGVRVTAGGHRAFVLTYRTRAGRQRRYTIGSFPDWSVVGARGEARRLKREVDQGGDPLAEIAAERGAPTVGDLIERFLAEHVARKRFRTRNTYRGIVENHVRPALGRTKVAEVSFADVDALHRRISKSGHRAQANRVLAVAAKLFALAVKWGMRPDNPAKGVETNSEHRRRRYLTPDELKRLIAALDAHADQQAADIVRLCLFTGCRSGEAMSARWDQFDLDAGVWTKPGATTKQKTTHSAPLSVAAKRMLAERRHKTNSEWVFPSDSESGHRANMQKAWARICKAAKVSGLHLHDLRHSFASQLVSTGASLPLIGSLLGHANPVTTARYAHLFDDPQRAAVERIGRIVTAAGRR